VSQVHPDHLVEDDAPGTRRPDAVAGRRPVAGGPGGATQAPWAVTMGSTTSTAPEPGDPVQGRLVDGLRGTPGRIVDTGLGRVRGRRGHLDAGQRAALRQLVEDPALAVAAMVSMAVKRAAARVTATTVRAARPGRRRTLRAANRTCRPRSPAPRLGAGHPASDDRPAGSAPR